MTGITWSRLSPDHLVHLTDERLRVCLERTVELDNVRLRLRDWPGFAGPLIHLADPFSNSTLAETLAANLAPRYRFMSLSPRRSVPYQLLAMDLLATLDQFGFASPILVGERAGGLTALLIAAWFRNRVGGVVLIDPSISLPPGDSVETRALRDCPPDWSALRAAVTCPVCQLQSGDERVTDEIDAFATAIR